MDFKQLVTLILLYVSLSSTSYANLIEIDINNDDSNIGFSQTGSSLVWLDLSVTKGLSISSINQRLTTDLQGYRWAKETEVLSLWHDVFFSKMGQENLPVLTGEAIPFVSGVWFGTNRESAGSNSDVFFESLYILGADSIETETNSIGYTYSHQTIFGYFESKYNNYGYAFSKINDKLLYRSCDPSPCFEETLHDRSQIWYFDDAAPLYKDNPNDSFSGASSFLVKVTEVSEPPTLFLIFLSLIYLQFIKRVNG